MNKKQFKEFVLETKYNALPPDEFLYDRQGPWPQPSPNHPFGESAAVLHIPISEFIYWWMKIGSRYVLDWFLKAPGALAKAFMWGGLSPVSDKEYADFFYHTSYAKFFSDQLTQDAKDLFKDYIVEGKKYLFVDFVGMKILDPIPGVYTEVSRTLFEVVDGGVLAIAINLRDYVLSPKDGELWELAKYISLMGAGNHIVVATHPRLHFPMDAINAITKSAVPMKHPLFKIIIPHTELTLKLNWQVLNSSMSLLQNKSWMVYAPFPATGHSMRDLVVLGYHGIQDNPCYPKYFYPLKGPQKIFSTYGDFQDIYYKVYFDFVKEVLSDISPNDQVITAWANYINQELPSFPNGVDIWKEDNLYHAVATYIWDVSLGHGADHKTYAEIPLNQNPMRIRVKSPMKKDTNFKLERKKIANIWDQTKLIMANTLFFKPYNVSTLMNVQYDFLEEKNQKAAAKFLKNMQETEKNLKIKNYMPTEEIPVSIQY